MALINCPDCGTDVSDAAVACPKCARPIAASGLNRSVASNKSKQNTSGCLVVFVLAIGGLWLFHSFGSTDNSSESSVAPAVQADQGNVGVAAPPPAASSAADSANDSSEPKPDKKCQADLQCMSDKFNAYATVYCKAPIESKAAHDVKWSDGFMTPMFERIAWANESHTQIRYIGDKAEFQNGFGAYTPVSYTCTYDTKNKQVIDVSVLEGRLPADGDIPAIDSSSGGNADGVGNASGGLTPEQAKEATDAIAHDLKDPRKVALMECMGVKVYQDPQPPGHPPTKDECSDVFRERGMNPSVYQPFPQSSATPSSVSSEQAASTAADTSADAQDAHYSPSATTVGIRTRIAGANAEAMSSYAAAIQHAVMRQWIRPRIMPSTSCVIHIEQLPGGTVVTAKVDASCPYDDQDRASVENAVWSAQPLPYKGFENVFQRNIDLTFAP